MERANRCMPAQSYFTYWGVEIIEFNIQERPGVVFDSGEIVCSGVITKGY